MAETQPNLGLSDSYPKGLDIYESFDQVTTGVARKKKIPIGVAEDGTRVPLTSEHILQSYGYGPEDLPKRERKKNKLWEKPTEGDEDGSEETAPTQEIKWNTYPEPKPAKWDSIAHGTDLPVLVLAQSDPDAEGNVFYKINHPVAVDSPIPKGELKFIIEPDPAEEPDSTDLEKKDKKVEGLPAKERALHPETILRLKEDFEKRLKNQMKDLESLKNTGRLAELYEQAEKTTSDLLRAAVVSDYLNSLSDEDRAEVEPLFDDLVNEMSSSEDALEIKRKMMSGGSEKTSETGDPAEETEKTTKFKEGQKVKVLRTSGDMEDDWEVDSDELTIINGKKYITVSKTLEEVTLYKDVLEDDLENWQGNGTSPEKANEEDDSWIRVGDLAIYKRGDITERNWRIDDKRVITKEDGKKYVVLRNSDLHTTAEVEYEIYKKWKQDEAGKPNEEEKPPVSIADTPPPGPEDDKETAKKKTSNRIKAFLYGVPLAVTGWLNGEKNKFEDDESLSEEEKRKKRRNRRLAGVAGILAAFGAGYLLCKVGHNVLDNDNGAKDGLVGVPGADGGDGGNGGGATVGEAPKDGPGYSNDRLPYDSDHGHEHKHDDDHSYAEGDEHHHHEHDHNAEGDVAAGGEDTDSNEKLGEEFNVEPGHGITHELQDFSKAQGFGELSGEESYRIYEEAREKFGVDLIDSLDKQADTYIRSQGDVGISNPGHAVWPTEVEQFFRQRLAA